MSETPYVNRFHENEAKNFKVQLWIEEDCRNNQQNATTSAAEAASSKAALLYRVLTVPVHSGIIEYYYESP